MQVGVFVLGLTKEGTGTCCLSRPGLSLLLVRGVCNTGKGSKCLSLVFRTPPHMPILRWAGPCPPLSCRGADHDTQIHRLPGISQRVAMLGRHLGRQRRRVIAGGNRSRGGGAPSREYAGTAPAIAPAVQGWHAARADARGRAGRKCRQRHPAAALTARRCATISTRSNAKRQAEQPGVFHCATILQSTAGPQGATAASASTASSCGIAALKPSSMPGMVCSIAAMLENFVTMVRREPPGVDSNLKVIPAGMASSAALSSPSLAAKPLMGSTAVNFQEPFHFSPSGKAKKYSARPPTRKSCAVKVAG